MFVLVFTVLCCFSFWFSLGFLSSRCRRRWVRGVGFYGTLLLFLWFSLGFLSSRWQVTLCRRRSVRGVRIGFYNTLLLFLGFSLGCLSSRWQVTLCRRRSVRGVRIGFYNTLLLFFWFSLGFLFPGGKSPSASGGRCEVFVLLTWSRCECHGRFIGLQRFYPSAFGREAETL